MISKSCNVTTIHLSIEIPFSSSLIFPPLSSNTLLELVILVNFNCFGWLPIIWSRVGIYCKLSYQKTKRDSRCLWWKLNYLYNDNSFYCGCLYFSLKPTWINLKIFDCPYLQSSLTSNVDICLSINDFRLQQKISNSTKSFRILSTIDST